MLTGNMPPTAPLASTAVRGNGVSDKWNSTEVAELDSVSYVSPVVDAFDWEGPSGGAAGHVAFSDMETIENADTQGGGWGQWGGPLYITCMIIGLSMSVICTLWRN